MKISAKYRAAAVFSAAFVLMSALAAANFAGSYNNAVTAEETSVTSATEGTSETAETEYGIAPMAYDDVYMPESEGDTYLIDLSKITIDADTVETGTQLVMSECITMSVREKNIHVMEEYGINSVYIRIVTAIRSGFKVNLSGIPQVVGGHSYSDITIHLIIENEGEITDFSCENSYARESSVSISLNNYGTISGGTYDCSVDNEEGGVIIGGNFSKTVTNHGTISDGNFNNGSYWVLNYGTVSGGTFQSYVLSQSSDGGISGGNFKDAIIFEHYEGYVTGGDFRNVSEVIWYGGSVTGGIFNESVKDVLPADSSCVFYNESEKTYTVQGDVTLDETFELNEGETLVIPDGAKVNNLEELRSSGNINGNVIEPHTHIDGKTFKPWTGGEIIDGSYYVAADGITYCTIDGNVDLCLNGKILDFNNYISSSVLNIYDDNAPGENVQFTLDSVYYSGKNANIYGGYVFLNDSMSSDITINVYDGKLGSSTNFSLYGNLNISGGEILCNIKISDSTITLSGSPKMDETTITTNTENPIQITGQLGTDVKCKVQLGKKGEYGKYDETGLFAVLSDESYATADNFEAAVEGYKVVKVGTKLYLTDHVHEDGTAFVPWTDTTKLPDTAGNWYLTGNVELTDYSGWKVPNGVTNLCLNGKRIINVELVVPTDAELNIYDCSKISGESGIDSTNDGSVGITNSGKVNIYGGSITFLKNAIVNEESGILNISYDAGIYAQINGYFNTGIINKGTMTIKNGMIAGSAAAIENSGTLTLENVTVYCTGVKLDGRDTPENAIVNTDMGTLTISGGSIGYDAGGGEESIFSSIYGIDNQGTLNLAGDVKFYTTTANIKTAKPINITGELTNKEQYEIYMTDPGVFAAGKFAAQSAEKFTPSSELATQGYIVTVTENNELAMDYRHYTYDDNGEFKLFQMKPARPVSLDSGIAVISLPENCDLKVNGKTVTDATVIDESTGKYIISVKISRENGFKIGENEIQGLISSNQEQTDVNGSGSYSIKVIVDPKPISAKFADDPTKPYDGNTVCTAEITSDGFVKGDDVSITAESCNFDSANAGTAKTVTASGLKITGEQKDFYKLENDEITGSGKITPKLLDIPAKEYTYDGKTSREIEIDGVNGETVKATLTAASKNAGTYTYNAAENGYTIELDSSNYAVDSAGTLTINKCLAKIEWQNETSFVYDGTEKSVAAEVTNAVDGDTFNIEYDGNTAANVGEYTAEILSLGNNNYSLGDNTSLKWKISAAVSESTNAEINYKNETISTNSKMEYSLDGETYFPCAENMSVTEFDWDGSKSVTVMFRYAADQNHSVGAVQTVVIPKRPTAPDISGMAVTKTQNSITVAEIAGCEYSIDGTAWQDSGTFNGLTAGKEYTVHIRTKAAENAFASFIAEKSIVTSDNSSGTTELKTGETVETENGSITNYGKTVELESKGNTTTVTLPDSGEVTVDESGNVNVPNGSIVETGKATVALPSGGKVSSDGTITADELQVGDVTVKGKNSTFDTDGNISIPNGGIIGKDGTAEKIISGGAVIDTEGNVIENSGTLPVVSAAAADGGDMSGVFEGSIESITLQIKISEIDDTDIELPEADIKHIYDISLIRNGEAVQPVNGKKIKITLYVPDDLNDPAIFRMENDGSFTDMNAEYDSSEKVISFVTVHLSNYVLAEKKSASLSENPKEPDNTDVPAEAAPAIPSHGIGMPPAVIGDTDSGEDVSSAAGTFSDENVIRTEGKSAAVWIFAVIIAAAAVTIIVRKTKQ